MGPCVPVPASALARSESPNPHPFEAIEVDDTELALILAPSRVSRGNSSSSALATPSTVSTADSRSQLLSCPPSSGAGWSRLVFRREDISGVKQSPKLDEDKKLGKGDDNPPFPHLVEFVGLARGAQQSAVVVLALPSAVLAARFQEALEG